MENETVPFEFGILRILDCGFLIEELIDIGDHNIKMGYGMNFSFSSKNNWVEFVIKAEFKHSESGITFIAGSVLTRFNILNISQYIDENNKVLFPPNPFEMLLGMALRHMRAILSKNIMGSRYCHICVPVVNPCITFSGSLSLNLATLTEKST